MLKEFCWLSTKYCSKETICGLLKQYGQTLSSSQPAVSMQYQSSMKCNKAGNMVQTCRPATANDLSPSHVLVDGMTRVYVSDDHSWQMRSGTSWHSSYRHVDAWVCSVLNTNVASLKSRLALNGQPVHERNSLGISVMRSCWPVHVISLAATFSIDCNHWNMLSVIPHSRVTAVQNVHCVSM